MRRRILSIMLSFLLALAIIPGVIYADTSETDVAINSTNFPDDLFRQYVSEHFDSDGNNSLSADEIANVTEIRLDYSGVTSFKGVEYFTALKTLTCDDNQLTSLDVSNNTALECLRCSKNRLTALDLSNNTSLRILDCFSNDLTSLDVSQNTALYDLSCYSNPLKTLDLSNNTTLCYLWCSDNQLTSLDLSNNTELVSLNCSENSLTSLDVSENTKLEGLWCHKNQLTTIDLSNNTALTSLICASNQLASLDVSGNTALRSLDCPENKLTSLDVSDNTALYQLTCGSNLLTEVDISNNLNLTNFSCDSNKLTKLDLSGNPKLSSFSCNYNKLTGLDLTNNAELRYFSCFGNDIEELDVHTCPNIVQAYVNGVFKEYDEYYSYTLLADNGYNLARIDVDKDTKVITVERIFGTDRFNTAVGAADQLKAELGMETFPNIVIASGKDFPDALAGAYLAVKKDAPILLTNAGFAPTVAAYVKENMDPSGTVYILGGKGAVPEVMETELQKQGITNIERLAGSNRYDTNLEILRTAGVEGQDLLICSGGGYADSLSASASGKPVLLVGNSLTNNQKDYLAGVKSSISGDCYAIGGKGVVSDEVFNEVKTYATGSAERISGKDRYKTSVAVAQKFMPETVNTVVLAYGMNYPDGLAGGPVAYAGEGPLLLVTDKNYADAKAYVEQVGAENIITMGGKSLISDSVVMDMLQ